MYNRAAAAWQAVLRNIDEALLITNGGRRARAAALNKFGEIISDSLGK